MRCDKTVLISIKPEWVKEIIRGTKTIEIRKTAPKLECPFKVYIYCSKNQHPIDCIRSFNGNIEFYEMEKINIGKPINGKVIGEFTCNHILEFNKDEYGANCYDIDDDSFEATCITLLDDLWQYGKGKTLYGWCIDNLKIYSEPVDVTKFKQVKVIRGYHTKSLDVTKNIDIDYLMHTKRIEVKFLTRAPQSWCYVNDMRGIL